MDNVHYHLDYATAVRVSDEAVFDFKQKILDQLAIMVEQQPIQTKGEITTEMVTKATNIVNLAWHKERILKHEFQIRQIEAEMANESNYN